MRTTIPTFFAGIRIPAVKCGPPAEVQANLKELQNEGERLSVRSFGIGGKDICCDRFEHFPAEDQRDKGYRG